MNNRRFTLRGMLGLALIVISSFLGYNWLTGDDTTAPGSDGSYTVGDIVTFYDVRLYDADSAIYTEAMSTCHAEDATCFGFTNTAQQIVDIELTITRLDGDKVWLSDGEGDALECDAKSIDTRNIGFLVCDEAVRTDMVTRQIAGLNATLTDAEMVEADKQAEFCYDNTTMACWFGETIRETVIGLVTGLF